MNGNRLFHAIGLALGGLGLLLGGIPFVRWLCAANKYGFKATGRGARQLMDWFAEWHPGLESMFWTGVALLIFGLLMALICDLADTGEAYQTEDSEGEDEDTEEDSESLESAPAPVTDVAGQLSQLKALLDAGAINQDEYEKGKAKILG